MREVSSVVQVNVLTGFPAGKNDLLAFADFHGVNSSTVSDFKLPLHHHWMQIWEEKDTVTSHKLTRKF